MARSYPGLDLVRLGAALMVALYHFAWFHPLHDQALPAFQVADGGWVGVQIFFVISGFVIAFSASRKDARSFIASRASRLYPAAWICASISAVIVWPSAPDYLRSLLLFPIGPWVNGVYWTLAVEIAFYALIAVSLWRGWNLHGIALLLGGFSAVCWLIRSVGLVLPVGPFGHYGCYFAIGMLLYERRSIGWALLFTLAGLAGCYWEARTLGFGYSAPFIWLAATGLCAACVFWNAAVCRLTASWPTRTLGLMTYPLYLLHDDVGGTVLSYGIVPALALSLGVAFAILPLEGRMRHRLFYTVRMLPAE